MVTVADGVATADELVVALVVLTDKNVRQDRGPLSLNVCEGNARILSDTADWLSCSLVKACHADVHTVVAALDMIQHELC